MRFISIIVVTLNYILYFAFGNPVNNEDSRSSRGSHIDITKPAGVGFEEGAQGHVYVHGLRFPRGSFEEEDELSFKFKTTKINALLFHGVSHHNPDEEQLTAYLQNGTVRVRVQGHCGWLFVSDVVVIVGVDAADGRFHSLTILVNEHGVRIRVDDAPERWFRHTRSNFFRCFKIQKLYFGKRNAFLNESSTYPELDYPMAGCIKSFRTGSIYTNQSADASDQQQIKASYSKVSSCHMLPGDQVDS